MSNLNVHHLFLAVTWASHHVLVMLLIGTPILGLGQHLRGHHDGAAWRMLRSYYPVMISLTITTGVAPLLFSQAFNHRYFYRTFINLFPLPLIGLLLLIGFFYLSYAVVKLDRWHTPMVITQIALLLCFALFFGALFNGMVYPEQLQAGFWGGLWPGLLWHSTGAHLLAAVIGSALFYRLSQRRWWIRVLPLLILAIIATVVREGIRIAILGEHYPQPILPGIDISIVVFLFFLALMIYVLYKAVRIAFSEDTSPTPEPEHLRD